MKKLPRMQNSGTPFGIFYFSEVNNNDKSMGYHLDKSSDEIKEERSIQEESDIRSMTTKKKYSHI